MRPLSVHTRLTLWYAGALLTILVVISALSYSLLAWSLAQDVDRSLLTLAGIVRDAPRGDAFALDRSERRYRLALAKRASRKRQPPCTFLLRTRDGHHRCGLGELRPAACRAFPSDLDPETRRRRLEGPDEIGLADQHREAIDAYEAQRDGRKPPVPVTTSL